MTIKCYLFSLWQFSLQSACQFKESRTHRSEYMQIHLFCCVLSSSIVYINILVGLYICSIKDYSLHFVVHSCVVQGQTNTLLDPLMTTNLNQNNLLMMLSRLLLRSYETVVNNSLYFYYILFVI